MADIQSIYNRLNSGTAFTPLSVDTFGDWSLEAGDVISVSKDGTTYSTPAMQSGLKWNGGSKVAISSLGDKQREPLSVLSRQQYASGGGRGGYWNARKAFTDIRKTDTEVSIIAQGQKTINGKVSTLESNFTVMADRIDASIAADGSIIASAAIKAVTDKYGNLSGEIRLQADHLYLDGNTTLNGVLSVTNGMADFKYGARFGNSTTIFPASGVQSNGFYVLSDEGRVNKLNVANVTKSGSNLLITHSDGSQETFSRAVTSADWTWSNGSAKAHLSPQDQNIYSPVIDTWVKSGSPSYDNTTKLVSQNFIITDEDGQSVTTMNFNISASDAFDAGYTVTSSEISETDRGYVTSQPTTGTRIFRTTSFLVNRYYQFDITVHGQTKRFWFYTQVTS